MQCEKIIVDVYGEKKEFFYKKNLDNRRNNRRRFLLESKDGDTYEGTLDEENNFKRGKLTQKNGDYQDGLWENGKFISGKVRITDNNDNVYKGEWKDNMRNGQGTYTCKKNGDYKDGLWENGKFISGKGRSTYSDGVYTGDYKNGDMNGKGEYLFKNGDRYVGEFQDGRRHGEGKLIDEDNCIYYEGNFQCNQKNGKGKYLFNNGYTVECTFVNGDFIKDYTIRERHHELCIVLVAAHDHDNEDKKRYLSLTEYNKMIKNKYNYERSDNLGFVVPHHKISGDYNKKEIDEELLTE